MIRPDLCLEFVNTRFWRGQAEPTETLKAPEDLAAWTAAQAGQRAPRPPSPREFERAIEVREMLHRLFDAEAGGKSPATRDLEGLNHALAAAPARTTLRRERGGYGWDVDAKSATALSLLAPVLWSAGDLLAGPRLDRVRRCANPECGWLFLDDSRAGKRRWCSMQSCGNRAKARRHYHKSRAEG
jgi:predicted RNA-binding Zn ribbon-like protein